MDAALSQPSDEQRLEAWLAERRKHITASDLPAIMGLPGAYSSPMGVWLDKKNQLERGPTPEHMEWGLRLQQPVLIGYAERVGQAIEFLDPYTLTVSARHPVLGASLDARRQFSDRRPVDAKNVGWKDPALWGEDGTDQMPARYIVQGHAQMEVTETGIFDLSVLFGGRKLSIYTVELDAEIVAGMAEAADRFWREYVLADIPPPVDASEEWTAFLNSRKQRLQHHVDVSDLSPEAQAAAAYWVRRLQKVKRLKKAVERQETLAGNHVRQLVGEHAGLLGSFGRIDYKRNKDSVVRDDDGYIAYLERIARAAGAKPTALARVRQRKFTSTKPGARPLTPHWASDEKKESAS